MRPPKRIKTEPKEHPQVKLETQNIEQPDTKDKVVPLAPSPANDNLQSELPKVKGEVKPGSDSEVEIKIEIPEDGGFEPLVDEYQWDPKSRSDTPLP